MDFIKSKNVFIQFILCLALFGFHVNGTSQVSTYQGVEKYRSAIYKVVVRQGVNAYESFVYQDSNKFVSNLWTMTDMNHWTTFSFAGPITVEVTKLTGNIGTCTIYPKQKKHTATVDGNTASFDLTKPEKLWIEVAGEYENPLFIFADAPETNVPSATDPNVVYWGPGIHNVGIHFPLQEGKTYYLAGGAYVRGSFLSSNTASNITIKGRGILSGELITACGYGGCGFDRVSIQLGGSQAKNLVVEGITIINPAMYCIQAYGGNLTTRNVKCMGWWYETDGWVAGDNSVIEDCFFKVNDDIIKMYFKGQKIKNLTIYKQFNGAVFQLGWGNEQSSNCTADSIYVINDEVTWTQTTMEGNRAFLNCANGSATNSTKNIFISNVWCDKDISYIVGIKTLGTYKNISINNFRVEGKQKYKSYFSVGSIDSVQFNNVNIGGNCVLKGDDLALQTGGTVTNILYSCDNQAPSIPTGLKISTIGNSSNALLTWTSSTDNVGVVSYEVYENSNFVSTVTSNSATLTNLTCGNSYTYTVKAKDLAGNLSVTSETVKYLGCSTSENDLYNVKDKNLTILPNPNKGEFNLDISNLNGKVKIEIFNEQGITLLKKECLGNNRLINIKLDKSMSGLFIIKATSDSKTLTGRTIVNR